MFDIRKIQEQVIYDAIASASDKDTAQSIIFGKNHEFSSEDNPTWVKNTMKRLEDNFDEKSAIHIRMNCQCGYGMDDKLIFLQELIQSSSSLEEFANNERSKAAGLSFSNGDLYLQFPYCPCPMLAEVDKLATKTWCQCTTGYSKVLFEKAFNCQTDVELLKSVKMGDDICLMKIVLKDLNWH